MQFTSASHLEPLHIRADGSFHLLKNDGEALGVFPAWEYEDSSIELMPGDRLLLFTDAITEAASNDGEDSDRIVWPTGVRTVRPLCSIVDCSTQ